MTHGFRCKMIIIIPDVLARRDTISIDVQKEMIDLAVGRCKPMMRALVDGKSLTEVLVKTYLQGFVDCWQAGEPNDAEDIR